MQKSYFLFIHSLCVNEVTDIIANQSIIKNIVGQKLIIITGTQQLHDVLKTIVDGAKTLPDPSVSLFVYMYSIMHGHIKGMCLCWYHQYCICYIRPAVLYKNSYSTIVTVIFMTDLLFCGTYSQLEQFHTSL